VACCLLALDLLAADFRQPSLPLQHPVLPVSLHQLLVVDLFPVHLVAVQDSPLQASLHSVAFLGLVLLPA